MSKHHSYIIDTLDEAATLCVHVRYSCHRARDRKQNQNHSNHKSQLWFGSAFLVCFVLFSVPVCVYVYCRSNKGFGRGCGIIDGDEELNCQDWKVRVVSSAEQKNHE